MPVYNVDNIDQIPNEHIQFTINDQLFFETLMMEIRGKTISYSSLEKNTKDNGWTKLQTKLDSLEINENIDDLIVERIEELKHLLQEIINKRLEGVAIRSRVKWLQDREKVSQYFCNFENRNFIEKSMSFLKEVIVIQYLIKKKY